MAPQRSVGVRMAAVLHMCNNFIIMKVCDDEMEVLDVPVRRCRIARSKQMQPCLEDGVTALIN